MSKITSAEIQNWAAKSLQSGGVISADEVAELKKTIGTDKLGANEQAALNDVIAHDARARGTDRAGVFSGVWTAGETAGMALGATVLTLILTATGYVSSVGSATVTQPASAVTGIVIAFSLVPAVLLVASILLLRRYRLRRDDIEPDAREASATPHTSGCVA